MHLRSDYETFTRYDASNEVFITTPSSKKFEKTLNYVIRPAIERASTPRMNLIPRTVNRDTDDSPDIHERIMDGILHSRLVIADITVQSSYLDDHARDRWQPNSNVAYEVGLAAAWRNPEDILLVHEVDEQHSYNFDVQNVRHVPYRVGDPQSVRILSQEIRGAIERSRFIADRFFEVVYAKLPPLVFNLLHASRGFPFILGTTDVNRVSISLQAWAVSQGVEAGVIKRRSVTRATVNYTHRVIQLYEWTELGLRALVESKVVTSDQMLKIRAAIESQPKGVMPPAPLVWDFEEKMWTFESDDSQ